jgi:diguanylate cyclase (GGDEF)-like protein/PAS domain S-box-containing protein
MLPGNMLLVGSYDYRLVVLSVVIATFASYAALDLAGRVTVARGSARFGWWAGGASAMGFGIWSMHYIGMLAFSLPIPVWYDWPIVLLSLLAAIFASAAALLVASGHGMSLRHTLSGSIVMGGGIGAMHYIGMHAMRMGAVCHFDPSVVALSVILAVMISFVALRLVFLARNHSETRGLRKFASAIVMGAAIPILHYTGMAAASFTVSDEAPDLSHAVAVSTLGMVGISAVTIMILGIATLTAAFNRLVREPSTMRTRVLSVRIRALRTAMLTFCIMLVFEAAKQALHPRTTIWTSHIVTILFATLVAAVLSFTVLRKEERLHFDLSSSEQRYRLLFERSLAGVYRTTLEGRVLDCNAAFCRMFGYASREEVLGHPVSAGYLSFTDRDRFKNRLQSENGLTNFEQCLLRKDGSAVWVLNNATVLPSEDGLEPVVEGTMTDISEHKSAEEDLRRLAAIVRCSDDAIISLTTGGIIQTWNLGAERIYGYNSEEVLGTPIDILVLSGQANDIQGVLEQVRIGNEVKHFETAHVRKDGGQIDIALTLSPMEDATGEVVGVSTIARDITHQKRAEEALLQSETQYRLLFESNPLPTWVFARKTLKFLAVNEAAIRHYGFSRRQFLGMTIADIRPEEDIPALLEATARLIHGLHQEVGTWRHRQKDGTIIDVEIVSHDLDFHGIEAELVAAHDITERKRSEEMLQNSENKYRVLFEDSADANWLMDEKGFLDCNSAALQMFGYSAGALMLHPADISPPNQPDGTSSRAAAEQKIASAFLNGKERFEWLHQRKNGNVFPAEVCLTALTLSGRPRLLATVRDITERKQAEEALLFKTALLEAQAETTIDGILAVDESDHIVLANKQFGLNFGIPDELLSTRDDLIVRKQVMDQVEDPDAFVEKVKYLYNHRDEKSRDELRFKNGKIFDRYSAPLVDSRGRYRGRIWYFRDITDSKVAEERVQYLAYYDPLTGLPNRTLLQDRLATALAGARRRKDRVALLFLDLDRFKVINDSLGHSCGDLLLRDVAERLKRWARQQDTVARLGGDEFLIVLTNIKEVSNAAVAAERLMDAMIAQFVIQGHSLSISCSVGISIFPEHGADGEILIKNADAAMYCAKESGRNNFQSFAEDMNAQVVERLTLENSLRLALEKGDLFLVYQPQMDIATGRITGLEALLRWQHPELGLVPPDKFIRIAENCGLIVPIGEWVLRTACFQARKWQDEGIPAVSVAVNVSAVQFRQEGFCELVRKILHETGLDPKYLELELTESLLLSNADVMFSVFRELKAMGLRLAIDDFGTGYSSLSYLKQFPVSKLKIDRSFVRDVALNADDAAITNAIISMAKSLSLKVIAEGVENEAQMSFLRAHHCDQIQGYYFSKPLSVADIADKLRGAEVHALTAHYGA